MDIPRLLPKAELPGYTFVPGTETPHPFRDPKGHSHHLKGLKTAKPLIADSWAENRTYLLAIDYFNLGYYWESHDEWERLWRSFRSRVNRRKVSQGAGEIVRSGR